MDNNNQKQDETITVSSVNATNFMERIDLSCNFVSDADATSDDTDRSVSSEVNELVTEGSTLLTKIETYCNSKDVKTNRRLMPQKVADYIIFLTRGLDDAIQRLGIICSEERSRADKLEGLLQQFQLDPLPSSNDSNLKQMETNVITGVVDAIKGLLRIKGSEGTDNAVDSSTGKRLFSEVVSGSKKQNDLHLKSTHIKEVAKVNISKAAKNFRSQDAARRSTIVIKPLGDSSLKQPRDIKSKLAQSINCQNLGIHLEKVNQTKKSNLVVKVQSEEEAKTLINSINSNSELRNLFTAAIPKNILKRVILSRVPLNVTEEQLLKSLADELKCDSSLLSIKKLSRADSTFITYLLYLPDALASVLLTKGRHLLNFHTILIKKYIRITRCFKCNCYGHTFHNCQFEVYCTKCSLGHDTKNCNSDSYSCVNCTSLKDDDIDCSHPANSPKCAVYQRLLKQDDDFPQFVRSDLQKTSVN